MRLRLAIRVLVMLVLVSVATALGYGGYMLSQLAPIGTAYAAKTLCSGVFVSNRAPDNVIAEDIRADNHPLLQAIHVWIDRPTTGASASLFGFARRDATFHSGRGCALSFESSEQPSRSATAPAPSVLPEQPLTADKHAGVDRARVRAALDWAFSEPDAHRLRRTRAVLVLHDGRLLEERYARGFSGQTPMLGWSMTKSVTAALIGILVRDGKLALDREALIPQWRGNGDPRAHIRLDHLLRMTSGLRFTEKYGDPLEDVAVMLFASRDGAAYAIDKPLAAQPGSRWSYSSGTSNILAALMREAIGGNEQDYLSFPQRALFTPIGMRNAVLETDASGTFVASSYMYASPHDWARFGQLLLQDGVWNGKRILPVGWVQYMRTLTELSTRKDFGAHLWLKVPPPFDSTQKPAPVLPADTFHAVGHEGQFVTVIPSRNLVIVRLGLSRGEHVWDHSAFVAMLLAAIPA